MFHGRLPVFFLRHRSNGIIIIVKHGDKLIELNYYLKMTAFRDIQPCTLVDVDPRFGGAYYLHHRPDDGGSMNLWNFGVLQRDYTALYPSKLSYSYSPP
jgi:hypothetical protein